MKRMAMFDPKYAQDYDFIMQERDLATTKEEGYKDNNMINKHSHVSIHDTRREGDYFHIEKDIHERSVPISNNLVSLMFDGSQMFAFSKENCDWSSPTTMNIITETRLGPEISGDKHDTFNVVASYGSEIIKRSHNNLAQAKLTTTTESLRHSNKDGESIEIRVPSQIYNINHSNMNISEINYNKPRCLSRHSHLTTLQRRCDKKLRNRGNFHMQFEDAVPTNTVMQVKNLASKTSFGASALEKPSAFQFKESHQGKQQITRHQAPPRSNTSSAYLHKSKAKVQTNSMTERERE